MFDTGVIRQFYYRVGYPPTHTSTRASVKYLIIIYTKPLPVAQGKHAEAEPLYRQSLAMHEKALGSEHPNVAI